MEEGGFAVFATTIGACGIAWSRRGVVGVQLPEKDEPATRSRLGRRFPQLRETVPPSEIASAIDSLRALLRGQATASRLEDLPLDLERVPEFHRRVYEVARTIPAGSSLTYGEIAQRLGEPGSAQAVGQALGRNPIPLIVPCHRVLAAGGKAGGFSAPGGVATKRRLLEIEGASLDGGQSSLF